MRKENCACREGLYLLVVVLILGVRGIAHSHSSVGAIVLVGGDGLVEGGIVLLIIEPLSTIITRRASMQMTTLQTLQPNSNEMYIS